MWLILKQKQEGTKGQSGVLSISIMGCVGVIFSVASRLQIDYLYTCHVYLYHHHHHHHHIIIWVHHVPQHTRTSLPHAALYIMSINRVKRNQYIVSGSSVSWGMGPMCCKTPLPHSLHCPSNIFISTCSIHHYRHLHIIIQTLPFFHHLYINISS